MKYLKKLKDWVLGYLYDSSVPMNDRMFVVFSLSYFAALLGAGAVGVFLHEPVSSIIATVGIVVFIVVLLACIVKFNKIKQAKVGVAFLMVFLFQPLMFFTKGGIYCGAPFSLFLGTLCLVLILEGRFRIVMCIIDLFVLAGCWLAAYYRPELVSNYSKEADLIYSFAKYIITCMVITIIIVFYNKMFKEEVKRSQENAKELEELNKSQNRFFSSMSHEIRTPINTVLGLNEIILRQEDASDEIIKDARNIQGAGKMLLALINDILDVSKIEAGKMDIVPVNYSVASLLSEIVNMIWLKAEEKGLKFNVDIDPGVPETLFGDEVRIKQILINLLNNAVKYTKEGSISLHMECEDAENENALLKITVEDTGMGIKPEALPHLFDTFQRVDEEKNRHIEGTGLGLSIVKQLVELMDGEISVSSVYTQGSTFLVTVKQGISSDKKIGDINISNAGSIGESDKFEHSFHAPDARILIVDDNEMNLEVEKKLIEGTDMTIDLVTSGAEALVKTVQYRYDVIFMDHLMPEMDGIECYEQIRKQSGGLNRSAPIIVLTANAGGENIELYNNTGFDGYLVKPVSGRALEEMLINHLPKEKVISKAGSEMTGSRISTASGYRKKKPVALCCSTMTDIPQEVLRELEITTVPFVVITEEGVFWDNVDIDSDELVRYMNSTEYLVSSGPPSQEQLLKTFSTLLEHAHHLIYITLASGISVEYSVVTELAKTFDNVSVVNSGYLSSSAGILVMIAGRLIQQNLPVERIIAELELAKQYINCSFIIKSTDVMARRGNISKFANNFLNSLWLRPVITMKKNMMAVGGFYFGSERKCYENYIKKVLAAPNINKDFVFVTYAGLSEEELLWIEEEVKKRIQFKHIVFQKASAGITSNCGPGTFGLLYLSESEKNYNLSALFHDELLDIDEEDLLEQEEVPVIVKTDVEETVPSEDQPEPESEKKWYEIIPGLDVAAALKNSGSEAALTSVLKMFYDSFDVKYGEIQNFYEATDWNNYTIKVHALKSGSRLVGALELGDKAEALEKAGKASDIGYIESHHDDMMADYRSIRDAMKSEFGPAEDLPEIPEDTLAEAYGAISEFSEAMDYDCVKMVLDSVKEYSLKPEDKEKFDKINALLAQMDWDGIKEVIQ